MLQSSQLMNATRGLNTIQTKRSSRHGGRRHGLSSSHIYQAGIHLERGFASMPRPPVKRHTIFCHACPSPALLSTACAIVINNKTDKTRGLPCLAPISAPSVLFIILLRIIRLKIRRFQDFCYVAPPFEQCCTSSTSSDVVRAASPAHPATNCKWRHVFMHLTNVQTSFFVRNMS